MRKITQIPLTLDLFEVQAKESPNPSQTKPKKKVAKTKKTKASSPKRTTEPYTKKQLEDAVEIANMEGFVSVGKFING